MTATHHAEQDVTFVAKWLAPRWKSVACFALTLLGAIAQCFPASTALHSLNGFATMVLATVGVHQATNAGVAPVQDVVDAVVAAVPPAVADTVAAAVTATTTGVLAPVTAAITAVADPIVGDDGSGGA